LIAINSENFKIDPKFYFIVQRERLCNHIDSLIFSTFQVIKELVRSFEQELNERLDSFEVYAITQILAIPDSLVLADVRNFQKASRVPLRRNQNRVLGPKAKATKTQSRGRK